LLVASEKLIVSIGDETIDRVSREITIGALAWIVRFKEATL
jgi:hypothetical protein